jgi:hypothetical protein
LPAARAHARFYITPHRYFKLRAKARHILSLIVTFGFIWVGILIFFGMMVTHDYSMFKNILTSGGTIVGMVVIMFIAILFTTLLGKLVGFVTNIITEVQYTL